MQKPQEPAFIGREQELKTLNRLLDLRSASLVVIKGRRRIGKSRLIGEFAKQFKHYTFSGLAPRKGMTAQSQRDEFAKQLSQQFHLPTLKADDWSDLFLYLANQTTSGRQVILFDEISWLATDDPDFLGKLKIAWDTHFKKNHELILILCSSVSTWIEKNILSNTGYLGRPTLHMTLQELPLSDCKKFWGSMDDKTSAYEKFKLLSVTGGVPRYLELINHNETAEENIRFLCFTPNGPLFDEFKYIFSDIYGKRSTTYQKIVGALENGSSSQKDISSNAHIIQGSDLSEYLDDLTNGGFVSRDHTWSLKNAKASKLSVYRLRDNYTRFYLKYITPQHENIEKGRFDERSITSLPGWNTILGLQFENLVINNHAAIIKALNIHNEDIVFDNPYFQRKTTRHPGCQIDYMIQTRHDCVYVCEIRFSRNEIKPDIIDEMKEKIKKIVLPRNFSYRPVLIHVNGVHEDVIDSRYFSHIVSFADLLSN